MANKPEVRMSSTAAVIFVAIVLLVVVGAFSGWFAPKAAAPIIAPTTPSGQPLSVVPAIEKTKIYVSTFDAGDWERDAQKNRIAGSFDLIKSGNVLETTNTSATSGVSSTAELNGGDVVTVIGDAPSAYADVIEGKAITETLQPFELFPKAASAPTVQTWDDKQNDITGENLTLLTNEVSKVMYIHLERPGDKKYYQLCGIAMNFDDNYLDIRVKDNSGSYVKGLTDLTDTYDDLKSAGADMVWKFDTTVKNFDMLDVPFVVGTAKDADPAGQSFTYTVFDCEKNLQAGKIVYTSEDSSDNDVGLANIEATISIN
jgi:hypothetical protein